MKGKYWILELGFVHFVTLFEKADHSARQGARREAERYDASGSLIDNRSDIRLLFTNRSNYPTRTDSYQLVLASENNHVLERPFKWLLGKLYRMLKGNLLKKNKSTYEELPYYPFVRN